MSGQELHVVDIPAGREPGFLSTELRERPVEKMGCEEVSVRGWEECGSDKGLLIQAA